MPIRSSPGLGLHLLEQHAHDRAGRRELDGEDVAERVEYYNGLYKRTFESVVGRYRDMYPVFGDSWVLPAALTWTFLASHGGPAFVMIREKIADIEFMKASSHLLERLAELNVSAQKLFREWHELNVGGTPALHPPLIKPSMEAMIGLVKPLPDDDALRGELQLQIRNQEAFLIAVFAQALEAVPDVPAIDGPVNPLAVGLDPSKWEADGLLDRSGMTIEDARGLGPGIDAFGTRPRRLRSSASAGCGGTGGGRAANHRRTAAGGRGRSGWEQVTNFGPRQMRLRLVLICLGLKRRTQTPGG